MQLRRVLLYGLIYRQSIGIVLYKRTLHHLDIVAPKAESATALVHHRVVRPLEEHRIAYRVAVVIVVIFGHIG